MRNALVLAAVSVVATSLAPVAAAAQDPWAPVAQALGKSGALFPGDVYKVSFPRSDMHVNAAGVAVKPGLALGSWVAFKREAGGAMAMGDLVLAEDELTPVISRLQQGGVEQTAIHHHLIRETPRVLYVHIMAHGDAVKIAQTMHDALALTKTPMAAAPPSPAAPIDLDTGAVATALGYHGAVNGGVYQVTVPRAHPIMERDAEIPASMGLATAINFQPTGAGKAAISGDFVMVASEVNDVVRTLRSNGIEAVSLHSHLLEEQPRLFFMHFWANDDAVKLAGGLKAALAKTNVKR